MVKFLEIVQTMFRTVYYFKLVGFLVNWYVLSKFKFYRKLEHYYLVSRALNQFPRHFTFKTILFLLWCSVISIIHLLISLVHCPSFVYSTLNVFHSLKVPFHYLPSFQWLRKGIMSLLIGLLNILRFCNGSF